MRESLCLLLVIEKPTKQKGFQTPADDQYLNAVGATSGVIMRTYPRAGKPLQAHIATKESRNQKRE
jgi:hypothetical protein